MEAYQYKPLVDPKTEIRLLALPRDVKLFLGRKNIAPLSGTLSNHPLPVSNLSRTTRILRAAKLPAFQALSYVWGDPIKSHEILINGTRLPITENLYNALRAIQKNAGGEVRVWADAICINQEDNAEKSDQILLMKEVYHAAYAVRIWMGLKSPAVTRCLEFIIKLTWSGPNPTENEEKSDEEYDALEEAFAGAVLKTFSAVAKGGMVFGQSLVQMGDIIEPAGVDDKAEMLMSVDESYSLHQDSIKEISNWRPSKKQLRKVEDEGDFIEIAGLISKVFLEHAWFTRMWVVQEVGTAERVEFQVGGVNISWEYVVRTIYYLHFVRKIPIDHISRLTRLEKIRCGWIDRQRQSLWDLTRECQYREATNPRDKFYSLFALMGDKMNINLKPNYAKSIAEVYSNVTRHFINQAQSLDRLCGWERTITEARKTWNLPSWVPDYTLNQDHAPSSLTPTDDHESIYAASGYDHRGKYTFSEKGKLPWSMLSTTGILVDGISILSNDNIASNLSATIYLWKTTLLSAGTILPGLSEDARQTLEELVSRMRRFYLDSNALIPVKDSEHPENDLVIDGEYILEAFLETVISDRVSPKERASQVYISQILNSDPHEMAASEFQAQIQSAISDGVTGRKLAITRNGNIGAVPDAAKAGDYICVLYGCSVPVVLRPGKEKDHCEFIGECYLHGFMDGEAIALNIKGILDEMTFILK